MAVVTGGFDFEEIPADKVEKQARGRKPSNTTVEMAEAFRKVNAGKAVLIRQLKVDLNGKDAKADKARISSTIRQAAKLANRNVKIDWNSEGVPQVSFTK